MPEIKWKTETRKVSELIPADYNPRRISEKQKADLARSLEKFGLVMPVVINSNGNVIGGHQRINIFADIGRTEIQVSVPDRLLTEDEEVELNLRLNQNGGSWDEDKFKEFGLDMLKEVGFGEDELGRFFQGKETVDDGFDEKEAVEAAKKQLWVKTGEIYELGDHRVMVGDSTDPEQVKELMGGVKATVIYCDPPYNIGLDYSSGFTKGDKYGGKDRETALDDNKSDANYSAFLEATIRNALGQSAQEAHVFYWCDERYIWMLQTLFARCGVRNKRVCMWIKESFNPTPQVAFNKVYEACVYGTVGKPFLNKGYKNAHEILNKEVGSGKQVFDDIFDLFNIWLAKRDGKSDYEHPTQKPVTLHEKPLRRCSAPGDVVMDLFGGSGSTMIACEQMKRRAFLMEQSLVFGQVIIDRWCRLTGRNWEKV